MTLRDLEDAGMTASLDTDGETLLVRPAEIAVNYRPQIRQAKAGMVAALRERLPQQEAALGLLFTDGWEIVER